MPLRDSAAGHSFPSVVVTCDARWVMAYAAGVPDERAELYASDGHLIVHPLFPVAPEWELLTSNRSFPEGMTVDEARRGIHAAHDLVLTRPIAVGETLTVQARIVAVGGRSAGATQETQFSAVDATGEVVWRSRFSSLFLGVAFEGVPTTDGTPWPSLPAAHVATDQGDQDDPLAVRRSLVRSVDAHVYSECARIWNPIHTDVVAARRAGLAAPILHGTATLARAVSIATELAEVSLGSVRRIAGRFGAMVDLDTSIDVRLLSASRSDDDRSATVLTFDVLNHHGQRAIANGLIEIDHR